MYHQKEEGDMLKKMGKGIAIFAVLIAVLSMVFFSCVSTKTETVEDSTPYGKYGTIKIATDPVTGYNQLCDENGNPIQLKGMSSFGLQWDDGSWVLNENAFDALAYDWNCDIIRLAMYVAEDGYATDPATILARVESGIQMATERGLYVLVDWHILSPGNPTNPIYLNAGVDLPEFAHIRAAHPDWTGPQLFFAYLSEKYGAQGNIMFETANEPNGLGSEDEATKVWEEKLVPYHKSVVEAIREYDADDIDNIVVLGTDNWSQFVNAPVGASVVVEEGKEGNLPQIMYAVHFYAGTHDTELNEDGVYWMGEKILDALKNGLPVMCTEWGTSEATGDGGPYIDYSERWLAFFDENNISWCAWSLALKNEISAAMKNTATREPVDNNGDGIPDWTKDELSISGNFVRAKIREEAAPMYGSKEIVANMEDGSPLPIVPGDSPITDYPVVVENVGGNNMLSLGPVAAGGVWSGPRVSFQELGTTYSIYQDLIFDVYLKDGLVGDKFEIQPILQTPNNGWWGQQPQVTLTDADFALDEATGLLKATVKLTMTGVVGGDKLGHITLLVGATNGFYLDNVGFETLYNGDISKAPVVPDNPGSFIGLPFDFEDGQREGWKKDGDSKVDYTQISIDAVGEGNYALSFPLKLEVGKNEWEDGARLSSSMGVYGKYDDCTAYDALAFNVYVDAGKATTGQISIEVCSIPDGEGYWYQSGTFTFDPTQGEEVTAPGGRKLLKYYAYVPLNNTTYGEYPFVESPIRNTILALHGVDCDFEGRIYYDNIRYVDAQNLDNIDTAFNRAAHEALAQ